MRAKFSILTLIIACTAVVFAAILMVAAPRISALPGTPNRRIDEVRGIIEREFYIEIAGETLTVGAAQGMVNALNDPYAHYFTPSQMTALDSQAKGQYHGIGVQVNVPSDAPYIEINRVFRGGAADSAGMVAGDRIVAVDDTACSQENLPEMIAQLRAETDAIIRVHVLRGEKVLTFELIPSAVTINRVMYTMIKDIGYIALYEFMGEDVDEFREAVASLKADGARGLIIDLRNNPGGMLKDAVNICDALLPPGIIVYTINRAGTRVDQRAVTDGCGLPLAVLVNGRSASASEILAGAVQDHRAGMVLGQRTFGKGVVQTLYPLSDGAGLQITTARYFTPSGRSIDGEGITPDFEIAPTDAESPYTIAGDIEVDTQLMRALEIFAGSIDAR